jgi:hypothetical protein
MLLISRRPENEAPENTEISLDERCRVYPRIAVADLVELLHEISVAFAESTNTRTLLPRLATGMSRHVSLIEIEAVSLHRNGGDVEITAYAPDSGRRWSGQRSARFLQRQAVRGALWSTDLEPARIARSPVRAQLKLGVGHAGLLLLSFETEISVDLGERGTDILVSVLMGHCQRLGQLDATARCCHEAHRNLAAEESKPKTEISVEVVPKTSTEISVDTIDTALVDCISSALAVTRGRIYGDSGAAKLLGLKPSTLQSKMRKLGIERARFVA